MSAPAERPTAWQQFTYSYGKVLPAPLQDWVEHDLAGPGAARRMVIRMTIPAIILLAPLLAFPTTPLVHAMMILPILLPFIYFALALNKVYRRHRLTQHGIDPYRVDAIKRHKERHDRANYEQRYGPRT